MCSMYLMCYMLGVLHVFHVFHVVMWLMHSKRLVGLLELNIDDQKHNDVDYSLLLLIRCSSTAALNASKYSPRETQVRDDRVDVHRFAYARNGNFRNDRPENPSVHRAISNIDKLVEVISLASKLKACRVNHVSTLGP
eukprot:m.55136 g.55136  ORF g.55136 m.55136 type:complete len:138 (+) comp22025_c0_seq2:67-480(+)